MREGKLSKDLCSDFISSLGKSEVSVCLVDWHRFISGQGARFYREKLQDFLSTGVVHQKARDETDQKARDKPTKKPVDKIKTTPKKPVDKFSALRGVNGGAVKPSVGLCRLQILLGAVLGLGVPVEAAVSGSGGLWMVFQKVWSDEFCKLFESY